MFPITSNTELNLGANFERRRHIGLRKIVGRTSTSVHASEYDIEYVTGANHTNFHGIQPGSGEWLALTSFLRQGFPGQLDIMSPSRQPLVERWHGLNILLSQDFIFLASSNTGLRLGGKS